MSTCFHWAASVLRSGPPQGVSTIATMRTTWRGTPHPPQEVTWTSHGTLWMETLPQEDRVTPAAMFLRHKEKKSIKEWFTQAEGTIRQEWVHASPHFIKQRAVHQDPSEGRSSRDDRNWAVGLRSKQAKLGWTLFNSPRTFCSYQKGYWKVSWDELNNPGAVPSVGKFVYAAFGFRFIYFH